MARDTAQAAVALGGGHGLFATLSALRRLEADLTIDSLTAVVTVADNGGSSGRLRGEFGVLPPGDLRMALAALCGDDEWGRTWAEVVQHRFAGEGDMRGHVVGNLLIVGLWELMGDHVRALDWVGPAAGRPGAGAADGGHPDGHHRRGARPRPGRPGPHHDRPRPGGGRHHRRRHRVRGPRPAVAPGLHRSPWTPSSTPTGCSSDPGSWFTSVIPHLMVPGLREALVNTSARLVVVLNLEPQEGETPGFGPEDHLAALFEHAPELKIHTVLADRGSVAHPDELERVAASAGAELVLADVAADDASDRHDHARLAAAFEGIVSRV